MVHIIICQGLSQFIQTVKLERQQVHAMLSPLIIVVQLAYITTSSIRACLVKRCAPSSVVAFVYNSIEIVLTGGGAHTLGGLF